MLRVCCAAAAVMLLAAGPARAQTGINLSWDDCGIRGTASASFT